MPGTEPSSCQDVRSYKDGASDGMYIDLEVSRQVELPCFSARPYWSLVQLPVGLSGLWGWILWPHSVVILSNIRMSLREWESFPSTQPHLLSQRTFTKHLFWVFNLLLVCSFKAWVFPFAASSNQLFGSVDHMSISDRSWSESLHSLLCPDYQILSPRTLSERSCVSFAANAHSGS
jgi:hypothetical protein